MSQIFFVVDGDRIVNSVRAPESYGVSQGWIQGDFGIGWIRDGDTFVPPPVDTEELFREVQLAVHARLDAFAQTRNYDNILSLCSYATSTNPQFAAEAQYGVSARDATWATCYQILAEAQAGIRPIPSGYSDIEPELPALAWPE